MASNVHHERNMVKASAASGLVLAALLSPRRSSSSRAAPRITVSSPATLRSRMRSRMLRAASSLTVEAPTAKRARSRARRSSPIRSRRAGRRRRRTLLPARRRSSRSTGRRVSRTREDRGRRDLRQVQDRPRDVRRVRRARRQVGAHPVAGGPEVLHAQHRGLHRVQQEGTDAGASGCGEAYNAAVQCSRESCISCITEANSFPLFSECQKKVGMQGICKSYETAQSAACQGYKNAGSPALECFPKTSTEAQEESFYTRVVGVTCSGP